MRNRHLAILLVAGLLLVISGCKKEYLSVVSGTDIPSEEVLGTEKGLKGAVESIHSSMTNYVHPINQGFGRGYYALLNLLDQHSDDAINTRPAYYMDQYRWEDLVNEESGQTAAIWDFFYDIIKRANVVLENHPNVTFTSEDASHQVKGTAHFYRAFGHFYLVQAYGKRWSTANLGELGVPLRSSYTLESLPRATVGEVYSFVNQEIAAAIAEFEAVKSQDSRTNSVSLRTAYGLASRIMLVQEKWTEAADYAQKAIDNSKCTLLSGDANLHGFNTIQPDWMWSTRILADQDPGYASLWFHFAMNAEGAYSLQLAINRSRYDEMGEKDVRRKWFLASDAKNWKDVQAFAASKGINSLFKSQDQYAAGSWEVTGLCIKFWTTVPNSRVADLPFMRLPEMYLNKAEALNEKGDLEGAKKTLTELIKTRDADFAPKANDKEALRTEIRNHRSVELYYEGFSWFDQKRYARPFDRVGSTNITKYLLTADKEGLKAQGEVAKSRNSGVNATYCPTNNAWDDTQWLWAIPYGEIKGAVGIVERNSRNPRPEGQ